MASDQELITPLVKILIAEGDPSDETLLDLSSLMI